MSFNKLFIIATAARSFIMERTELESLIREELIYALAENKEHAKEILQLDEAGVGDFLKGAWKKAKRAATGDDTEKWAAIGRGEDPDKDVSYDPFPKDDDATAGPTIQKTKQQLMKLQDEYNRLEDPADKKRAQKTFAQIARLIIPKVARAHSTEEADAWKELLTMAQGYAGKADDAAETPAAAGTPSAKPSDAKAPESPDASSTGAGKKVTLSMKDRGKGARSSSIHNIALGALGLDKAPDPQVDKKLNRQFNKVMIDLTKTIAAHLKKNYPDLKVQSVNETQIQNIIKKKIAESIAKELKKRQLI